MDILYVDLLFFVCFNTGDGLDLVDIRHRLDIFSSYADMINLLTTKYYDLY